MNFHYLLQFLADHPERWAAALIFAAALGLVSFWRWRQRLLGSLVRHLAIFDLDFESAPLAGYTVLFAASFATLFFELLIIRWLAVEVRLFAYFKNLNLISCFLGFGLGCYLSPRRVNVFHGLVAMGVLILLVRLPALAGIEAFYSLLSEGLALSPDAVIWAGVFRNAPALVRAELAFLCAAVVGLLLLLLVAIFVPFGQLVGRQLDAAPNTIRAYSVNLAGSLAGILAFIGVGAASLPPAVWIALGLPAVLLCYRKDRRAWIGGAVLFLGMAAVLWDRNSDSIRYYWSPYQQLTVFPVKSSDLTLGYHIAVNHTGYMSIVDMRPEFVRLHPEFFPEMPFNPYDLPFRLARRTRQVRIVGAGGGNDVAAALRYGRRKGVNVIDAVEIDPLIYRLGGELHPERPYHDSRVRMTINDARAFLRQTQERYDLIIFDLLDSHTQLSDYSNMRVDNYVYTLESLEEARRLLAPDGLLVLKFEVRQPWTWIGSRLYRMLEIVFGKPPLVFWAPAAVTSSATVFAASPSSDFPSWLGRDPALLSYMREHPPAFEARTAGAIRPTTDDWPYFYHRDRSIPRTYLAVSLILILLTVVLRRTRVGDTNINWRFFFLGAGFLLLETQVISRLALFFGTTWQVNGFVIAAVLTMLLLANTFVERMRVGSLTPHYTGLFLALLVNFLFPLDRLPLPTRQVGALAALMLATPVFFCGHCLRGVIPAM